MIQWHWKKFSELSNNELYELLKLRQDVFIIEQNCIYPDIDDYDKTAWHLMAWDSTAQKMVAYLRVIFPGQKYKEVSIGRVLTMKEVRGTGLGKELLRQALLKIKSEYPRQAIKLSAQQHLHQFYTQFGFKIISKPYDEDGILHVAMLNTTSLRSK